MKILPGQLAYFIVLAIFPLLTLFGYIGTKFEIFSLSFISALSKFVPNNVLQVFLPFITESHITGNVTFLMILGFFLVSNGTYSIIVTSNELYGIENTDYIRNRIKAFFMIVLLMFLFIFIFIVLAYGNVIVGKIISSNLFDSISDKIYLVFVLVKWPVAFILIFWILKLLYTMAPDKSIPSKYMNKGALFTTICWLITTTVYSYYVSHWANYTLFYGSISGIIVMMTWIYFLSYIFVMGIAINTDEYTLIIKKNREKK